MALSPTKFSRIQEKHELQDLNTRFATYIGRVKYLETENSKLTQELNSSKEMTTQEVFNIKVLFESELEGLRNALDNVAEQKSRLEVKNRNKNIEVDELKVKFDKATKELKEASSYKARFYELNSKYSQTLKYSKNLEDDNKKFTTELATTNQNFIIIQEKLEEEMIQRVNVENKLKSLKESFKFKEEVHKQQLNDTITSHSTEIISEVDGQLLKEYEEKLQSELQTLRSQADQDVQRNKKEIADLFDSKFQHLENELQRKIKAMESLHDDFNAANARVTELTQQVNDLLLSNNSYLAKIGDVEQQIELQRLKYKSEIQSLEKQLTDMQDKMWQKVQEYQGLMDIKVALDLEISAYRKLLESEEKRLSISPKISVVGSPRGKKRKLFHYDESKLLNLEGQEVNSLEATHELKKGQVSYLHGNDDETKLFHQPGEPQNNHKCSIM